MNAFETKCARQYEARMYREASEHEEGKDMDFFELAKNDLREHARVTVICPAPGCDAIEHGDCFFKDYSSCPIYKSSGLFRRAHAYELKRDDLHDQLEKEICHEGE